MQNGPQIDLGEDSVASRYRRRKRKRGRGPWRLLGLVLVGSALIAMGVMKWGGSSAKDSRGPAAQQGAGGKSLSKLQESVAKSTSVPAQQSIRSKEAIAQDDNRQLWASPTQGEPLDLHYLPMGAQLLIHVRPKALWDHPESEKIVAVLAPWGDRLLARFQRWYPGTYEEVPALMLAVGTDVRGNLHYVLRVELASAWTETTLQERLGRHGRGPFQPSRHRGQSYGQAAGLAYWLPPAEAGGILVVCLPTDMVGLIEKGQEQIGLPRDVQRLVAATDRQRIFTALLSVQFLQGTGRRVFDGSRGTVPTLASALAWLWGEDATATVLSLHWDRDFFIELLATATLNVRPHHFARELSERVSELSDWSQRTLQMAVIQPYGRQVLTRLPDMLRILKDYTRSGIEQGHVVLRCYLPVRAGHNLLLAGALRLTATIGGEHGVARGGGEAQIVMAKREATIEEKLASRTSLVLPNETLEQSLQILAEDLGVDIEILGQDLQLAGITKNQSFGIDLKNLPAREILLEILRRANPDRAATGPADPRQMLVYTIRRREGGFPRIFVTTRTAAAARGDRLPEVFHPKQQ